MKIKSIYIILIALMLLIACDDTKNETAEKTDSLKQIPGYTPREQNPDLSNSLLLKMKPGTSYIIIVQADDSLHSVLTNELSEKLQETKMFQQNILGYLVDVLDVAPNGDFTIRFSLRSISYRLEQDGKLIKVFNSDEIKRPEQIPSDFIAKYALIGKEQRVRLNNMGIVTEVFDKDSIVNVYLRQFNTDTSQINPRMREIAEVIFGFKEYYKFFSDILNYTTEKPVFFKTEWQKSYETAQEKTSLVTVNYLFDGINDTAKVILFQSEMIDQTPNKEELKGQYRVKTFTEGGAYGKILLDPETNFLLERDMFVRLIYTETQKRRNDDEHYLHSVRHRYTEQSIYVEKL